VNLISETQNIIKKVGNIQTLEWFLQSAIGCEYYDRYGLPLISQSNPSISEVRDLLVAYGETFLLLKVAGKINLENELLVKELLGREFLNL